MDLNALVESLKEAKPPSDLSHGIEALWHEAKGDWGKAHQIVQGHSDPASAWVHAYLHRAEGDQSNAAYWYRRAGKPVCSAPLPEEWQQIASEILGR